MQRRLYESFWLIGCVAGLPLTACYTCFTFHCSLSRISIMCTWITVWNEIEVLTAVRCVVWSVNYDMMLMVTSVL